MPDNFPLMIELAKKRMTEEMPQEMETSSIGQSSGLMQRLFPNAYATTLPWNRVSLNPRNMQGLPSDRIEDILAHELTHVRQNNRGGGLLSRLFQNALQNTKPPSGQNPLELEATQTANDRAVREHRSPMPTPSFLGGDSYPFDIPIPRSR